MLQLTSLAAFQDEDIADFVDSPLEDPLSHPEWFKLSFLDVREDLEEAIESGKKGVIVYFGQKRCPYCKKMLDDFNKPDIHTYTQKYFDVIGINIYGDRTVTDMAGEEMTEREFSLRNNTNFTPSLIFYVGDGEQALRLRGYYPPYRFRAALEFVADGYFRQENFRTYLARADVPLIFEPGDMNYENYFLPPPFMLDRTRWPGERPLVVFFEQGNCHACDVLHTGPLMEPDLEERFARMEVVQLPFWGSVPVVTPDGRRLMARQWAASLGIFYTPTLIFFDETGNEIIRVDSVVQFYRLKNVLDYVLSGDYREYRNFQAWRSARDQVRSIQ